MVLICTGKWQLIVAAAAAATASAASIRVNAVPCTFRTFFGPLFAVALVWRSPYTHRSLFMVCGIYKYCRSYTFRRNSIFVNVTNLNFKYAIPFCARLGRIIIVFILVAERVVHLLLESQYSGKTVMTNMKSNHSRCMSLLLYWSCTL